MQMSKCYDLHRSTFLFPSTLKIFVRTDFWNTCVQSMSSLDQWAGRILAFDCLCGFSPLVFYGKCQSNYIFFTQIQ